MEKIKWVRESFGLWEQKGWVMDKENGKRKWDPTLLGLVGIFPIQKKQEDYVGMDQMAKWNAELGRSEWIYIVNWMGECSRPWVNF